MRTVGHGTGRRLTVALATTVGAVLLSGTVVAGTAAAHDGEADDPVLVDPQTLGEALPTSYVAATFNVLGNSHTAGSDPRPSGATRMVATVELLRQNAVDVVGLQELEKPQKRAFQELAGETYRVYSPPNDPRDSIAWRRSRFALVGTDGVRIPYKENVRTMPVVILRDRLTGKRTIVMSVHNVAGAGDLWVKRRAISVRRELAKIAELRTATGLPVLFVGDFNDRSQRFYCRMAANELPSSSVWWQTVPPATCELPRRAGIDWIFGNPGLAFTGYLKLDGGLVDEASDHPFVVARVLR
jgi:endonuclease/exonuclease/phosphatase family metal-dependent hydrolase